MSRPLALAGLVALLAACSPAAPPLAGWAGGSFVLAAAEERGAPAGGAPADVGAPAGAEGPDGGRGPGGTAAPTPAPTATPGASPSPSPTASPGRIRAGGGGSRRRPTPTPGPGLAIDVVDEVYADPVASEAAVVAP